MPESRTVPKRLNSKLADQAPDGDTLRLLSRSPKPYHHLRGELPHPSERLAPSSSTFSTSSRATHSKANDVAGDNLSLYSRGGTPRSNSDSGTEADDEHFLKGLPAPRLRSHKGLRGGDATISGASSPLPSPSILNEGEERVLSGRRKGAALAKRISLDDTVRAEEKFRRKRWAEIRRRITEVALLGVVGTIIVRDEDVMLVLKSWERELTCQFIIFAGLTLLYPLRLIRVSAGLTYRRWLTKIIPAEFDPAPLLYPPWLTMFVAALLSPANPAAILPNILLGIASLPPELIPTLPTPESRSNLHWLLACVPLFVSQAMNETVDTVPTSMTSDYSAVWTQKLRPEILVLLYPLHESLCVTLHYLTTTSLLQAELQLLSISLINVLMLSSSPQAVILKALLWGGGVGMFLLCGRVLKWVVALARVPKWRFRRTGNVGKHHRRSKSSSKSFLSLLFGVKSYAGTGSGALESDDEELFALPPRQRKTNNPQLVIPNANGQEMNPEVTMSAIDSWPNHLLTKTVTDPSSPLGNSVNVPRRHTLPNIEPPVVQINKRTSGRRKRSASSTLQSFFSLTEREATVRKWAYAVYVYACVAVIILGGIRYYVGTYALEGHEPIGWALSYLFGNIPDFRMTVLTSNLESWICLPSRNKSDYKASCHLGWVEHLRQSNFGPANTRLILSVYWLGIIIVGLAVVFRLSAIYEVDTRRKVFHFMMVAMLLPATYVDPTFAALALTLILAIFLLLDLFRASQLEPLSKPLASFLTPYVDGRDLRGPVVISHIFLLIGCAIPLWLSLGALGRTGEGCWSGWDVPTRDVSMVAGVICVGMGDAAASLIGRRYGRHKWFWPGGKSIEGSIAFATAVGTALVLAKGWLRFGGWAITGETADAWITTAWKAVVAASIASLTEAVLTGGNDNVVVPVVLWLCVKGLRI